MEKIKIQAQVRADIGKGASRRLRREEKVPAIVYGHHITPQALELEARHIASLMKNKALSSQIFELQVGSHTHQVIIKNLARHAFKNKAMHLEFQALSATEKVSIEIPLVFVNEDKCDGIKKGGELIVNMKTVRVRCLPDSIPEKIEVDLQSLTLETVLHLSQLSWPNGVESQDLNLGSEHDLPVLAIHAVKSVSESSADGESQ